VKRTTKEIKETDTRTPRKSSKPKKKMIGIAPELYEIIKAHADNYGLSAEQFITRAIQRQLADERIRR
jgi:predicted HicB family RNase H-like nuclease